MDGFAAMLDERGYSLGTGHDYLQCLWVYAAVHAWQVFLLGQIAIH